MKSIYFTCVVVFCWVAPIRAADDCCESPRTAVLQKMREIEAQAALRIYEVLVNEKAKVELELIKLSLVDKSESSAEGGKTYSQLNDRRERLGREMAVRRQEILKLADEESGAEK